MYPFQKLFQDYDFLEIKRDFQRALVGIFPNMEYAIFSGSVAYGGGIKGKSDIDVAVVLNENGFFTEDEALLKSKEFAKIYIDINLKHGFVPDRVFPGEVLTKNLIDDAIEGRGFSFINDKLYLPQASVEYYLRDPEHWFRAWLSMSALGVFGFGSENKFLEAKKKAWKTVLLFTFQDSIQEKYTSRSIIKLLSSGSNKWLGIGVTKNYYLFKKYEKKIIEETLEELLNQGYLFKKGIYYYLRREMINEWKQKTISNLKNKSIRRANFLLPESKIEEISNFADNYRPSFLVIDSPILKGSLG